MLHPLWFLFALILPQAAQAAQAGLSNRLVDHPSPYLAMHGADPVHWQSWGPEVVQRARAENKILFVSSGYFACHWCHVMQRESYRNASVAALLNAHFIPVKVDRELQPGLDAYLIDFVQQTRGTAGWPLNVFITPEGYPLLGLTYAPTQTFQRLLVRLSGAWKGQGEELSAMARRASAEMQSRAAPSGDPDAVDPAVLLHTLKTQVLRVGDDLQGGFGQQTRFPMAPHLKVLLDLQAQRPDARLENFLRVTLEQMAGQGLRDHLAGGFYRYTVDPSWQIPHFEKMLYNQALHVPLFLQAAEQLERPEFRQVARDTLDFARRDMRAGIGGYLASLSAVDDEGVEGGSYLWSEAQLNALLGKTERELAALVWAMQGTPNNEGGYLPVQGMSLEEAAKELQLSLEQAERLLGSIRAKLMLSRAARSLPRDDKPVTSWNGLLLSAFAAGVQAFGDDYRVAGQELRDFLLTRLWDGEQLHRSLGPKGWIGDASLEDYAFVARGLDDWYKVSANEEDRKLAKRLLQLAWEGYYDEGWRQTRSRLLPALPAEPALPDSPLPSPAVMLIHLTMELGDTALKQRARQALDLSVASARGNPFGYAGTVWALWAWRNIGVSSP